jgi:hypothetical protein
MVLIRRAGRRAADVGAEAPADGLDRYLDFIRTARQTMMEPPPDYHYTCFEDFVLRAGVRFESQPLTAEDRKIVKTACRVWKTAAYGDCYMNAQRLVHLFERDDVRYAEGYAQGAAFMPVLHGWVVLPSGAIYDPTWKPEDHGGSDPSCGLLGVLPNGWAYRGVIFSHEEVTAHMEATQMWATMIDNWQGGFPLLKEER